MAIEGIDVFPIREHSQHEKELQSVFSCLKTLESRMIANRAEPLEVLLYQTSLLYQAMLGGQIGLEKDDPRIPALDRADSLSKYTRNDDDPFGLEHPFLAPEYSAEVYKEVFQLLIEEKYDLFFSHVECEGIYPETEEWIEQSRKYVSFLTSFYHPGIRVLDLDATYLPPDFNFDGFEHYVILEQEPVLHAFFILRKEIEGDTWHNVSVLDTLPAGDEKFDSILTEFRCFTASLTLELLYGLLTDNGHLLLRGFSLRVGNRNLLPIQYNDIYNSGMLQSAISLDELGLPHKELYILRKGQVHDAPVTFADLGNEYQTSELLGRFTMDTLSDLEPGHVVSVSPGDIIPGNLDPRYYLSLRATQKAGTVPLSSFIGNAIDGLVTLGKNTEAIMEVTTDPRILESTARVSHLPRFEYLSVSVPCILIRKFEGDVGYMSPKKGKTMAVCRHITAYPVNLQKADIRYLVLQIRRIMPYLKWCLNNNDLLRYHIPALSLDGQREYVNDYLRNLRNDFVGKIDIKDSTVNIIVFSPDGKAFEATNRERMNKLGFRVLKYVEDKHSLKEALADHSGGKVLSSELADAVLVCADMPATDVEKAIYFIGKTGIRAFYYSSDPAFNPGGIDEDYMDDFKAGFLGGDDYLDRIRQKLDAESNKVRDRYPKFFKAADRLDEEYGWGLAEFATSTLQSNPFKLDINKLRSKIDETVIAFFKSRHVAPEEMDEGAVPSLIADRKYYDTVKKVNIILTEKFYDDTLVSEAWYKYALVAIRKLGNKGSHSSSVVSDSSLEQAAFTLFTEIIVWLDSVRGRYEDRRCLFSIKNRKGNMDLPFHTVESYDVDGEEYLVANGIHLMDKKHKLHAGDQVAVLYAEDEKCPKTINGFRVEKVANPDNYIWAIKA